MIEAISNLSVFQIVILCLSALLIGINKTALTKVIAEMEKSCRYTGHITLNVDPA